MSDDSLRLDFLRWKLLSWSSSEQKKTLEFDVLSDVEQSDGQRQDPVGL